MKKIFSILIALFFVLTMFGCKSKDVDTNTANTNKKYKIAYISDTYGQEDVKNKQVIEGVNESFNNYDFTFDINTPKKPEEYDAVINTMLTSTKYDLVLSNSSAVSSSLVSFHSQYDSSNIGLIGYADETNNGMSITFKAEEGAFLAGVLAAKQTKSNVVGYIGAYNDRNLDYEYGFRSGVKAVNKNIKVERAFTGSYMNSIEGAKKAEELHGKKVDVIFTVCGAGAIGVNNVAKEKNFKVIDSDLYNKSDNEVKLAEVYKDYKNATMSICDAVIYESFDKKVNNMGIADSVVDLKLSSNFFTESDEINTILEKVKKDIITKNVIIPKDNKSYEAFKYNIND
ncbi:BMP family protein [Anaerofustis sp.]|uniref:BMP family lipoprotein n=1 Tax=Anaerofustis sp. TaxID=1872517 RepID=UPI0025BB61B0|nr:BMP family ABC transporter substrate-binding protein [Anaerofustis sp.]